MTWAINALGWLGTTALVLCGVPLVYHTRTGDRWFFWLWLLGEVCLFACVALTTGDPRLLANYGFNAALVAFVLVHRRHRA